MGGWVWGYYTDWPGMQTPEPDAADTHPGNDRDGEPPDVACSVVAESVEDARLASGQGRPQAAAPPASNVAFAQ